MADCQQGADIFSMITPAASITISTTMPTRKSRYMASMMGVRGELTLPTLLDDERFRPFGSLQSCPVPVSGRCRVIWLTAQDFRDIRLTVCSYAVSDLKSRRSAVLRGDIPQELPCRRPAAYRASPRKS